MTYYIEGRLFWENIIDINKQKKGIMNIKKLPSETIDFSWNPITGKYQYYVQYIKKAGKLPMSLEDAEKSPDVIGFHPKQITYIDYGQYGPGGKKDIIGYLDKARQPYNQLKLLETSVIIYRLVRAPERLVFRIDVGNMPRDKAMKYVETVKTKLQKKINYDPSTGKMINEPNVLCIRKNTEIPLLNGKFKTLEELVNEHKNGIQNWVYSINRDTLQIEPGKIVNAKISRPNEKLIRIHLNNGCFIDTTYDHKFILANNTEKRADELLVNDILMSLNKEISPLNERIKSQKRIEKIYNPKSQKFEFTYELVANKIFENKNNSKKNIKFIDNNLNNNYPENLTYINESEFNDKDKINEQKNNQNINYSISLIEYLNEKDDTGCLEIDGNHNFAISQNSKTLCFINNSLLENFFLPQSCLSLDTEVALLDGRDVKLEGLIKEYEEGKKNWVYSVDRDSGEIKFGEIEWAGITKRDQKIVRVHLDNGKYIDATYDHKFILKNGSYCEASDLKSGDSLMPFYIKEEKINKKYDYLQIYEPASDKYEFVHRLVLQQKKGNAIHHKNFNRFDNTPENLESLPIKDHIKLHSEMNHYRWDNDINYRNKMTESKKFWWENHQDYKKELSILKKNYFIKHPEARNKMSILMKNRWNNPTFREKSINALRYKTDNHCKNLSNNCLIYNIKAYPKLGDIFKREVIKAGKNINKNQIIQILQNNKDFINVFLKCCKKSDKNISNHFILKLINDQFGLRNFTEFKSVIFGNNYNDLMKLNFKLGKILASEFILMGNRPNVDELLNNLKKNKEFNEITKDYNYGREIKSYFVKKIITDILGYRTYTDFRNNFIVNHRVLKLEFLNDVQDVGCLTIKDPGDNHNFALTAGVFVKNSEGRGSSVESIGGNPSGFAELEDLHYFQRKLYRALKYPMSRVESNFEKQNKDILFSGSGGEIARDETKWGRFLKKHQDKFCDAFLDLFLLHLDFMGLSTQYDITKAKLNISMTVPNNFIEQMQQHEMSQKWDNYNTTDKEEFSKYWRMKKYLGLTDSEILENIAGLKKDKELGLTPSDNTSGY